MFVYICQYADGIAVTLCRVRRRPGWPTVCNKTLCPLPKQRVCPSVVLVAAGPGASVRSRLGNGWVRSEWGADTKPTLKPQNETLPSNGWLYEWLV